MELKLFQKLQLISSFLLLGLFVFSCGESVQKSLSKKKQKEFVKAEKSGPVREKETFDILKFLVDEEAKDDRKAKIDYKNQSVSFKNDGDPYEVSYSKIAAEDLNHDGLTDYILTRNSEGMLGGNANTNSEILYLIMGPDDRIAQRHEILTYAAFSYNILEVISYKKGKLQVEATQNYRTYMPEDDEPLDATDLNFIYKNGNVYEESYLEECELAKWKNKQLFRGSEVTRTIDMHNYTESVHEKLSTQEFTFSADFSGCDNLNLVLEATFAYKGKNQEFIWQKRDRFLEYLKNNTSLTKEISAIQSYFTDKDPSEEAIDLDDFTFRLSSNQEKGKTTFRLIIDQTKNPDQTENWEITTRH
ncbi:hypothetical protein [uncultured Fluviicola sp.]|uniref:hypothetical protein n=1 Tax=uncultured Fluviicola sp. TaxID=463303 RepID=UPI00260108C1|nr:hypothetical protein [uncultured Fluviicola sp.]